MPPRFCCCDCFTYEEDFIRVPSNSDELEPDWEACGPWSDWTIAPLVNTAANAVIVLKHMVGNPYGILTGGIEAIEGAIYQILVFQGSPDPDACVGSPDYVVEIEFESDTNGFIRIKDATDVLEEAEFSTSTPDVDFRVCVSDNLIEAKTETSDTIRHCATTTKYWFALKGVTVGTIWEWIKYEDHYLNNAACPRCEKPPCFEDFNRAIAGFTIKIEFIGPGTNISPCGDGVTNSCADTVAEFDVLLSEDQDKCQRELTFIVDPDNPDPSSHSVPGPHNCGIFGSTSVPFVTLNCETPGIIAWSMSFLPDDQTGEGETQWYHEFPSGTPPEGISAYRQAWITDTGDGHACNYEDALITVTPIVVSGCCSEPAEILAMEAQNHLTDPCPFLEGNTCGIASMLTETPIQVDAATCKACEACSRPRRLNEVTITLLPEGDIRDKAVKSMLNEEGVGTDLSKVFGIFAEANMSCGCSGLKDILNTWTYDQIRANKTKVIDRIYSEAQKRKLKVHRIVISSILEAVLLKNRTIG